MKSDLARIFRIVRLIKEAQGYLGEAIGPERRRIINEVVRGGKSIENLGRVASSLNDEWLRRELVRRMEELAAKAPFSPQARRQMATILEIAHTQGIKDLKLLNLAARYLSKYELSPITFNWIKETRPTLTRFLERNLALNIHPHWFGTRTVGTGAKAFETRYLPKEVIESVHPRFRKLYQRFLSMAGEASQAAASAAQHTIPSSGRGARLSSLLQKVAPSAEAAAAEAATARRLTRLKSFLSGLRGRFGGLGEAGSILARMRSSPWARRAGIGAAIAIPTIALFNYLKGRSQPQTSRLSIPAGVPGFAAPLALGLGGGALLAALMARRRRRKEEEE